MISSEVAPQFGAYDRSMKPSKQDSQTRTASVNMARDQCATASSSEGGDGNCMHMQPRSSKEPPAMIH